MPGIKLNMAIKRIVQVSQELTQYLNVDSSRE